MLKRGNKKSFVETNWFVNAITPQIIGKKYGKIPSFIFPFWTLFFMSIFRTMKLTEKHMKKIPAMVIIDVSIILFPYNFVKL